MTIAAGEAGLSGPGVLETTVGSGSAVAAVLVVVVAALAGEEEQKHLGSVSTAASAWERELDPERERESELKPGSWLLRYACSGQRGGWPRWPLRS